MAIKNDDRAPFTREQIAYSRRHPQAVAHGLPTAESMIQANIRWQTKRAEKKAASLVGYLRAQEKSQSEVVDAFDRFLEQCLAAVQESCRCPLEDLCLHFGELRKDYSQDFMISVGDVDVMLVSRSRKSRWDPPGSARADSGAST